MTNEELNKALYDKCDKEFDAFIDEMNQAFQDKANSRYKLEHGDEFLSEYAYQYTIYGDILMALEDLELSDEKCQALLNSPSPLYSIYDEWLGTESGHMDGIRDCIELNAEKEMISQQRENNGQNDHNLDSLEFRLGLYNQFIPAYPADMEEGRGFGIALQAYQDGEPYGVATVNVPSITGICEFIGIKNSAYMDTNNFPWVTEFLDKGIAKDTGFTRRSGFCEYPLYQFDENWLKSLKPIVSDRTYDAYEKKYNQAMGIEEINKESDDKNLLGKRVKLIKMEGEDPNRMFNGLEGTIIHIDDIGQIHVNWDNGSSLALNEDVDEFEILEHQKLFVRPVTEQERDYTYTQERRILEDSGCVGHLRVDMDTTGNSFFTDWTDHVHELNDSSFKSEFDYIINELRTNSLYGNILTSRNDMRKYCDKNAEDAYFGGTPLVYGFRVDSGNWSCLLRLDPTPGNYAAYIYAYDKDSLDEHLEDMRNREKITVLEIEPGKEPKTIEIYEDLYSLQNEVGGLIECVYPWDDSAGIIVNEEGKLMGLPLNRALRDNDGDIYDVVAGTMLVVGLTEDNFGSLTAEQIEMYSDMFRQPETILYLDGNLLAFPKDDIKQIPIYLKPAEYAAANGEIEAYRHSYGANVKCKQAIENALADNYSNNRLNTDNAWKQVTDTFGKERVTTLLAQTCKELSNDGRISGENIKWASEISTPDDKFIVEKPHIGLVDLLASKARKDTVKERESIYKKLDEKKADIKPSNKSKKKGLEI